MMSLLLITSWIGIICAIKSTSAYPQRVYVDTLPYYPPPTGTPQPIRFRRSADTAPLSKGVSITTNSASGNLYSGDSNRIDAKVTQTETHFPTGRMAEGSIVRIKWANANGFGASVGRDINKGVSDTSSKSLNANLYNNDKNSLDAIYSQSHIKQDNGFNFDKTSGMLNWSNSGGHGLNADLSRYEGFGKQASLGGYTNLYKSDDGNTRVNAQASASKWLSGPFEDRFDYGFGLGVSHSFYG